MPPLENTFLPALAGLPAATDLHRTLYMEKTVSFTAMRIIMFMLVDLTHPRHNHTPS